MTNPAIDRLESCVTCGQEVTTPFCPRCGERRASDRTYSTWEFVKDHVIESVVSFDGRVIRTAKTLILKPGELTAAFMRGVRLPYLSPLQLFLIFNLGFFLWSSATHMRIFDTPLVVPVAGEPYSGVAMRMVRERLASTHATSEKEFVARFDAIGTAQARTLIVAMVPMFALVCAVAFTRWRRRTPFVKHVVFALHVYSFLFVVLVAGWYVIDAPLIALLKAMQVKPGGYGYDMETSLAELAVFCVYVAMASRRAYDIGKLRSILTAPALGLGIYAILTAYRGLLFFVTFYSM